MFSIQANMMTETVFSRGDMAMGMQMTVKGSRGFTLVELMITVAIIAVLATIALPAYSDYVKKSRRSDAYAALTGLTLDQEKFRANNPTYTATIGAGGLNWANTEITRDYYTIAITAADGVGFTATATATGDQTDDAEGTVSCATLQVLVDNTGESRTPAECW